MAAKKLLLIDGNSVAFRAFFALYNQVERFTNGDGLHTSAIFAFKNMLDVVLKREQPDNVLVAFDAGKTTFRTKMFDDYKGSRAKTPVELLEQLPYLREMLTYLGIKSYELAEYEADDIIGTLALAGEKAGYDVVVVTGDRDLTQLSTDKVRVDVTVKGVNEIEQYTPAHVLEKLGVTPRQIIDLKALTGDTSDNYPGVTKVGKVTAEKLVKEYGSVEGIYEQIDSMKQSKMKENLLNDREQAFLSKQLATIKQDAPLEITLAETVLKEPDLIKLRQFYQQMNFQSFLAKLDQNNAINLDLGADEGAATVPVQPEIQYVTLTREMLKANIFGNQSEVTFYLELLGENYHLADLIGFGLLVADQIYVSDDVTLLQEPAVKSMLMDESIKKNVFDLKRTTVALNRLGITAAGLNYDMLLASYLINNENNSNDVSTVAAQYDYTSVLSDEAVFGKGVKTAVPTEVAELLQHIANKLMAISDLKPTLLKKLAEHEQDSLYDEIEIPLAKVLAQMEITGITVKAPTLTTMQNDLALRLQELEQKIYAEVGEEFNLNSPKQLGTILFDKLGLPPIKKTKTGYSTSVEVLEELKSQSPVVQEILDYRQINKIQSTYVTGLLKVIMGDGKVHTRYLQTLTATGRLSSVDPNLQNIPIRIDEGKQIRKAFVASKPGWQIFSSDYSQIELRVLAHVSGDQTMQQAFMDGIDIHANTAIRIFNLSSPHEVTSLMRRQAKAVNFGIVYGISDFGLAKNIGIARSQAKQFIEGYFATYPQVHEFMQQSVKSARENGFVETIMHRRRYLPDIHSKNFNLRSFAERTAMNSPIQGGAADIIKIAMINMNKALAENKLQTRMLLQVHDELIFEVPDEELETIKKLVPSVMDSAVKLDVPLKVEYGYGPTWYDVK
ncbi:DNA polymerase I [Amylolactobacillus amylotrophicus DSM 20534]|uniref:DNA polymerase I n=3 Tax=Amylolactobacillus TaxID=2767876 RepID=A0A0R1YHS1_9LACO|nr:MULTISPECIES: DNA polymerase I [Amylolactobacillus]APT17997.1 DNA polymerase I [Amylolactobacillus amylophilus DSM 20533 = JCM 1125]KRK37280.1 DNA polymerase I [Amylolactobacillus amylotrophicus DSM 20534]KRM41679.1 DNA polymerase I [Amylolactobacillus amylophilus DSM 20533 = JCM 1125]GED80723.1 DNA polymerase [Amylolactobacillus amylophilus]